MMLNLKSKMAKGLHYHPVNPHGSLMSWFRKSINVVNFKVAKKKIIFGMAFSNWYLSLPWKLAFELLTLSWKAYSLVAIKLVSIFSYFNSQEESHYKKLKCKLIISWITQNLNNRGKSLNQKLFGKKKCLFKSLLSSGFIVLKIS